MAIGETTSSVEELLCALGDETGSQREQGTEGEEDEKVCVEAALEKGDFGGKAEMGDGEGWKEEFVGVVRKR